MGISSIVDGLLSNLSEFELDPHPLDPYRSSFPQRSSFRTPNGLSLYLSREVKMQHLHANNTVNGIFSLFSVQSVEQLRFTRRHPNTSKGQNRRSESESDEYTSNTNYLIASGPIGAKAISLGRPVRMPIM